MAKYPPLFKKIPIDFNSTGQLIAKSQEEFEKFWNKLNKLCPANSERTMAMRKLQEASHWFSRAICVNGFDPNQPEAISIDLNGSKDDPATIALVDAVALNTALKIPVKSAIKT